MATVVRPRPTRDDPASGTRRVGLASESRRRCRAVVVVTEVAEVSVEGYALGDYERAFAQLHRRAYDVAYQLLGYRAEAEDVAQEALARAFIHWPKIHEYAEPWVVRVAGNLAIGSWRKNRRLTALPDSDAADATGRGRSGRAAVGSPDPDRAAHNLSDHLELRRALARLSKRQREVVILRHLAGYSERETATTLGCSSGTVKQHSSRGLAALRLVLDLDGGDAPDSAKDEPRNFDGDVDVTDAPAVVGTTTPDGGRSVGAADGPGAPGAGGAPAIVTGDPAGRAEGGA